MRIWNRNPALRWGAPLLAAGLVIGGGAWATSQPASAGGTLPERTPAQLLDDVQRARVAGISGTVRQTADLGIPDLPGMSSGHGDSSDLSSLVSGTHTLKVWSAGPGESRVALLGGTGESDIVRNGRDTWIWSSGDNTARHIVAPAHAESRASRPAPTDLPTTTQETAEDALKAMDPSTEVSAGPSDTVAGRPAYELVLRPRDASKVRQVRIAIDGAEHVPTRVQVFAVGHAAPAIEVAFTSVDFSRPAASRFQFTPPKGSTVIQENPEAHDPSDGPRATAEKPKVVGEGWASVIVAKAPADGQRAKSDGANEANLRDTIGALPKVSGGWGSGHLLDGTLFSVLFTDDGRVVAGAVPPEALYSALTAR